jgi:hypothetical protein
LTLGPDGAWFQVADGEAQTLQARPTHARLLTRLADLHTSAPERRISVTELFELGWPGQTASHESATNRVHVTLAQLRKLGLASVLEHDEDGYRLDPEWLVVRRRGATYASGGEGTSSLGPRRT